MNDMYNRMKTLLSKTGIDFSDGSYSKAEIYAYAFAMQYVKEYLEKIMKTVFVFFDDCDEIYEYSHLLNLRKSDFTLEQLKKRICSRLGMPFGGYTKTSFNDAFNEIGSGKYLITKSKVIFSDIDDKDLHKLGDFIESYIFICKDFAYDGTGLTFDERDGCNINFHECDKMNLPFDIIDTLRRK